MKHSEHYKIKWHDTNANREVRPSKILMYMQETANAHLLANGLSLDSLRDERSLAFLLSRIAIRFYKPLFTGDEIEVQTWICEGHGFAFDRCFVVIRGNEVIAEAYSVWALLNLKEKRLMRTNEFSYGFPPELPLESELVTRLRMPAVSSMTYAGERKIVFSDIDYNGHMNNTNYPDMLCDFVPQIHQKRVVSLTLSFLHEATYEHSLQVYRKEEENGFYFRTLDTDGTVCLDALMQLEEIAAVQQ
jgi:acyl-CoA thioesterase FadM